MLDINPDTIYRLIDLAREFHSRETVAETEDAVHADDEWAAQLLADHGDDATFEEFKSIVDDLEPGQQQQLVALLWLGREDYSLDEWDEAVDEAQYHWTPHTAQYLLGHPYLADHLEKGLEEHGYSSA